MSEELSQSVQHNLALSDEAEPTPSWGALPVEQYLIRSWDWSSPQPSQEQRLALVRAFLALDNIPAEWDCTRGIPSHRRELQRVPTEDEVRIILQPWRPARWRWVASQIWTRRGTWNEAIWLRTHYAEGTDDKFAEWRATDEDNDPNYDEDTVKWTVLNDRDVFNFGDEWWRVFDVLPELAGPQGGYFRGGPQDMMQELREELRQDIERRAATGQHERPEDAAVLEAEYGEHGQKLQVFAVASFLLVADARAFETDRLRLLYLDHKGNIVRHSTVEVEYAWETRNYWSGYRFEEATWWGHKHNLLTGESDEDGGELADEYHARGSLGRLLYGLDL
ncbi:hypothetical protein VTJ49DRAFT_6293 [Mycothermus thermophilus]|uniref:Uncharacterized protein n=1 Tax=Humicola insolens TaxID=85995 RepID=A0ABR3V1J1_HUMIN